MKIRKKKKMAVLLIAALFLFVHGSIGVVWAVAEEDSQIQRQQGRTLQPSVKKDAQRAAVYMTTDISPQGMMKVYEALNWIPSGKVAVKLSTGEPPASNYLRPELIKDLVQSVNGTIVECNTAYGGSRASTAMHYQVAADHGFTEIADFQILDEDGSMSLPVEGGTHLQENLVGAHFADYESYLVLSHFKGHSMAGFGGAIKNISIGLGSSEGKSWIHSGGTSKTNPWGGDQNAFLESMAEAGKAVSDYLGNGDRIVYVNVMNRLSVDCDCDGNPAEPDMHDVGILASTDPVAVDQACIDLVYAQKDGKGASLVRRIESRNGLLTLEHAENIGLGSRDYELVDVDVTESPDVTDKPDVAESPDVTDKPDVTESPSVTDKPDVAESPDVTDSPSATNSPNVTVGPATTNSPDITNNPEECDHNYTSQVTAATTDQNGSIITKCTICGTVETETAIYAASTVELSQDTFTYNGKTKRPFVTVDDSQGTALKENTDYTVVYPDSMRNVGTYTVEVRFRNHYTGTVQRSFTIYPKSTSVTRATSKKKRLIVVWKKQKKQIGGYELAYSASSKFSKKKATIVNVKGANKTKKVISKLKAGKKYYVRIRTYKTAGGKTYYSGWSRSKSVKIRR